MSSRTVRALTATCRSKAAATTAAAMPARRLAPVTRAAGTERPYCDPQGVNHVAARLCRADPDPELPHHQRGRLENRLVCSLPGSAHLERPESLSWAVAA